MDYNKANNVSSEQRQAIGRAMLRRKKPIKSKYEDSLPKRKTDKLAAAGWDYKNGAWHPPKKINLGR